MEQTEEETKQPLTTYITFTGTETPTPSSLSDHFKEFKKRRQEKFKHQQYLKTQKQTERHTQEFQDQLRKKFVETAKSYFGVPYAKRFHQPGSKLYESPIFLDCCALVRQCVYDLREEFGFTLGRWNQGYQFDTLPIDLKFEELQPGDLIFYTATYYDQTKKKQPHDMVHVEIYTGGETGEQSIGARWFNGVVQYFDSYKFTSTNYYDIKFYYKSIKTWLEGECQSHCSFHPWRDDRNLWQSEKYSIFAEEFEEEAQPMALDQQPIQQKQNTAKFVYIGKGNNDKLIRDYFSKQSNWVIMNSKDNFSNKYSFKWTQTTSEIDFLKFKENQQIHLLQTIQEYEQQTQLQFSATFLPQTYRLDVMSDEIQFLNNTNKGIWIKKNSSSNQGRGIQMINNIELFKEEFLKSKKFYLGEYAYKYLMDYPSNTNIVNNHQDAMKKQVGGGEEEQKENIGFKKNFFIGLDQSNKENYNNQMKEQQEEVKWRYGRSTSSIIQKYIENPLLLENKKFDIRCYVLIASTNPYFILYHHGYLRRSLVDFDLHDVEDTKNRYIHLTNASIQKCHPKFKTEKENTIWTMNQFEEYLTQNNLRTETQINELYKQIYKILYYTIKAGLKKLERRSGQYELLGCDIMIDDNYNPYLIELNTNPALFLDTKVQSEIIPEVMKKTLDLILSINENQENYIERLKEQNPFKVKDRKFTILYNEAMGYEYQ